MTSVFCGGLTVVQAAGLAKRRLNLVDEREAFWILIQEVRNECAGLDGRRQRVEALSSQEQIY